MGFSAFSYIINRRIQGLKPEIVLSDETPEKEPASQEPETKPIRMINRDSELFKKEIFDGIELPIHVDGTYHGFALFLEII